MAHVRELTPDPDNRRVHNPRNVGMLVDALQKVGAARSIVIDEDGTVLAGNATLEAAAEAGITDVTIVDASGSELVAVRRTGLSAEQKRQLAMYDNRVAELASWDVEQLQLDAAAGLDLEPFWTETERVKLLGTVARDGRTDPDAVPELRPTDIQRGDLFELGAHRLLCGDATDAGDVARLMHDAQASLLITSPPYNQRINTFAPSGMHREGQWVAKVRRLAYADSLPEDEYQRQQLSALHVWAVHLADESSIFYNHKNRYREKAIISPLSWLCLGPFTVRQEIVWSRPGSVTQNARMFLPSDERIYWLYKGSDFYFDDSTEIKTWSTVWEIPIEANLSHAVGFPVELPRRAIRACSRAAAIVLEPYAGSGTTLIAAEQLGRLCRAIEIEPGSCQVTIDRFEAFTGQRAVKVGEAVAS